jgi:hypothetical protein
MAPMLVAGRHHHFGTKNVSQSNQVILIGIED